MSLQECLICGERFSSEIKFCPGCGADDKSFKEINAEKATTEIVQEEIPAAASKPKAGNRDDATVKSISIIKLVYLGIFLFFVGAILMYSSGVFDSPTTVSASNVNPDPHAGVDLTNLQEINRLEESIKSNSNDLNALLNLAHLYNDSGFKEKAIERYNKYLDSNPNSPDVLVDLGVCYYELGKNENAIMNMEKAIKIDSKHQIGHLNLGVVNFSLGNVEKAKEYWKKAISINPTTEIAQRAQELINQH